MVRSDNIRDITKEDQIFLDKQKTELDQLISTDKPVDQPPSKKPCDDDQENDRRKAEAELLLAIGQNSPVKPAEAPSDGLKAELPVDAGTNQRKSTRVKKLKTFKDEIVYFPPSSVKSYNITPDPSLGSKSLVPVAPEEAPTPVTNNKRKLSTSSVQGIAIPALPVVPDKPEVVAKKSRPSRSADRTTKLSPITAEQAPVKTSRKRLEETKKARLESYFNSLKLAKSNKKPIKKSAQASQDVQKENKRKKKKDIIKKLIESSQLQLRKQQELIESQLKQHRHEKTKRKMLKLLKKQRLVDEQRNFAMENLNSFDVNGEPNENKTLANKGKRTIFSTKIRIINYLKNLN